MPQVRLMGLILFITTIFIALAAAATQTKELKFKGPDVTPRNSDNDVDVDPGELQHEHPENSITFITVPIVWPLAAAGTLGLMLWFVPAPLSSSRKKTTRRRRKRRRKHQRSR